jgi:hypothetical protein
MAEVQAKLGKVQIALEALGKQINDLENWSVQVQQKTEPVRLQTEPDDSPEAPREEACPVANSVMMYTDRLETVTRRLQRVFSELEV